MDFTIEPAPPSSGRLDPDAAAAYRRFHQHARALAALSADCARDAREASALYLTALAAAVPDAWQPFVGSVEALVRHSTPALPALARDGREAAAHAFLAQIVRENADLLDEAVAFV